MPDKTVIQPQYNAHIKRFRGHRKIWQAYIMNSDQGCQFTGFEWTQALKEADVKI